MIPDPYRRKLRKLRKHPFRFAYDFLGKRIEPLPGPPVGRKRAFDVNLFRELNDEYRNRPIVPAPPSYDSASLKARGKQRVEGLNHIVPLANARVLEIGCGQGEVVREIAARYPGAHVLGVDVQRRDRWQEVTEPNARVMVHDISKGANHELGRFDLIVAITVWEHMEHPYSALRAVKELLADAGRAYLTINLYRGTHASHLYRDVYFPWPHLLFEDEVFLDYYDYIGKPAEVPAWVNKLTAEQYIAYFDEIGLSPETLSYRTTKIDEAFYKRFEAQFSKYPRRDLEREYLNVVLVHKES
jgi:SAM-dependent methyltransferase